MLSTIWEAQLVALTDKKDAKTVASGNYAVRGVDSVTEHNTNFSAFTCVPDDPHLFVNGTVSAVPSVVSGVSIPN